MSAPKFTQAMIEAHNQRVRVGAVLAKVKAPHPFTPAPVPKRKPQKRSASYNRKVVIAFFAEYGIPEPEFEHRFAKDIGRKWRFDLSWETFASNTYKLAGGDFPVIHHCMVALEVQGGIFSHGRHTQGAALLDEWEKLNCAAVMGWRMLFCQPSELCMDATAQMIKRALKIIS